MTTFTIPTLQTPRLTLRAPVLADFEPYATFFASPRASFMDGPHSRTSAWSWFCVDTAHWALFGYGGLTIEVGDQPAGSVVLSRGKDFPEPELGWFLYDGFTGKGYAAEAAFALRDWAYANTGLNTLVSYIDSANTASIRLAEQLGATPDPDAALPPGDSGDQTLVYRHPSPDALSGGGLEAYS